MYGCPELQIEFIAIFVLLCNVLSVLGKAIEQEARLGESAILMLRDPFPDGGRSLADN